MLNFLILMLIPIGIATFTIFYFKKAVTLAEFGLQLAVPAVLMVVGLCVCYYQSTTDVELWNGRIVAKARQVVSCRHSYECNCTNVCSGSGKSRSCTRICQTCYEHPYDVDWRISADTNESLTINTIDRQGLREPPRWTAAYVGEPFSSSHEYTNYILANPDSVLLGGKGDIERFKALLPKYDATVFDYYRAHHVINMGVPNVDMNVWNWLVNEINGDLGPKKQVNVTVVLAKTDDPQYTLALKDQWLGGKKNDAVVVIGSLDGHKIAFSDVISWSPNGLFGVTLKDDILQAGSLDNNRDGIAKAIRTDVQDKFQRMHMKDYQYLVRSFQPSSTAMMVLFILGCLSSIGLAVWSVNNDITDDSTQPPYGRSRPYYSKY